MHRLLSTALLFGLVQTAAAQPYLGVKAGYLSPGASAADETAAASVTLGYELIDFLTADAALEAEYTQTLDDGDLNLPGGVTADYDYSSYGLFGVFRTPGPAYFRARAGVVHQQFEVRGASTDSNDAAAGIGVGFSLLGLEASLDWTRYLDGDALDEVDYLSFGLRF